MSDMLTPTLTLPRAATTPEAATLYLRFKHAHALFDTPPQRLDEAQRGEVDRVVARQRSIETRILGSRQAAHVADNPEVAARNLDAIASRFASEAEFVLELARAGLSLPLLHEALAREARVEAILEFVSARVAPVSNLETELFYHLHHARFTQPEKRTLRHILLTINPALAGSSRAEALARIESLQAGLRAHPDRFAELALRHSECPTALQGGLLGTLPRGELFPALDAAAFALRRGELSAIVESPLGFHLLRCDNLQPAGALPLARVRERIREQMLEARRHNRQRAWVRQIMAPLGGT
ncbi:MAG: nitrogen fixation protein NifM [Candidatus Dactylopiibacterium sp.]|nr:nitrogen fixation protein NifM [Candidatus Dactylopiibacterium sp.]